MAAHTLHERTGFDIGWDYACYGIAFPPGFFEANGQFKCIVDGYTQGVAHFGHRRNGSGHLSGDSWYRSKWMNLRLSALKRNRILAREVTPDYLSKIYVARCPVTRVELTRGTGAPTDASIERMNNSGGYAPGNLCVMSIQANQAKGAKTFRQVLQTALTIKPEETISGLTNSQWARLACLSSFGAQADDADVVNSLPLVCMPPIGCLLTNQSQHLQTMVTAFLPPHFDPRLVSRINKAFGSLKDKKVKRALERFADASKFAYNRAYHDSERPLNLEFILGDAWKNAVLYGYWDELRQRVGDRVDAVIRCVDVKPNPGLTGQGSKDFETWGLESHGHIPASEW